MERLLRIVDSKEIPGFMAQTPNTHVSKDHKWTILITLNHSDIVTENNHVCHSVLQEKMRL